MGSRSERVLITGGAGFTGRPLAERLRQDGHEVAALSRGDGDGRELDVDLCNFDAISGAFNRIRPTAIVHLAGIASPTHTQIGEMYSANVVGTANLFAALVSIKLEPRIVIVASSGQLYASPDAERLADRRRTAGAEDPLRRQQACDRRNCCDLFAPVPDYRHPSVQLYRPRSNGDLPRSRRSSSITLSNGARFVSET